MEPMTLGSPPPPSGVYGGGGGGGGVYGSGGIVYGGIYGGAGGVTGGTILPGAAGTPTSTAPAPFLPSYLLGTESRVPAPGSSSPGRSLYPGQCSPASPHSAKETHPPNFATPRFGRSERPSGPPVAGLSPHTPNLSRLPHSPFHTDLHRTAAHRTPMGSPASALRGGYHTPMQAGARHSDALNSSIISSEVHTEASANAGICDEWVTVFGFPVASVSYILTQFAQLGTIADQRLPGTGNWMHLKYQTPLQARKALALSGKIFGNNIMIGVTPCTDKSVIGDLAANKENMSMLANTSGFMSPNTSLIPGHNTSLAAGHNSSMVGHNTSLAAGLNTSIAGHDTSHQHFSTPKANIRSLTQRPAENQVVPAANTPKKNDSFMSKAMHHLLGV